MKDTHKATISIKAESMPALVAALTQIAERASMQIVQRANVSTSIAIEADDIDDLIDALGATAGAVARCDGVEAKIAAPATAWDGRRIDLTPMERMINDQASGLFPGEEKTTGERALDWLIDREK